MKRFTEWFADEFEGISAREVDSLLGMAFAADGKIDLNTDLLLFLSDTNDIDNSSEDMPASAAAWNEKVALRVKKQTLDRLASPDGATTNQESESSAAVLALRKALESRAKQCSLQNISCVHLHNNDPRAIASVLGVDGCAAADALLHGLCADVGSAVGITLQYVGAVETPFSLAVQRTGEQGGSAASASEDAVELETAEDIDARITALASAASDRGDIAIFSNGSHEVGASASSGDDQDRLLCVFYFLSLQKEQMGSDCFERLSEAYAELRDAWATGPFRATVVVCLDVNLEC